MKRLTILAAGAAMILTACQPNPCSERAMYQAVKDHLSGLLRSPATAEFVSLSDLDVSGSVGICHFTMAGHLDSENDFGAFVRSEFATIVTWNENLGHRVEVIYLRSR